MNALAHWKRTYTVSLFPNVVLMCGFADRPSVYHVQRNMVRIRTNDSLPFTFNSLLTYIRRHSIRWISYIVIIGNHKRHPSHSLYVCTQTQATISIRRLNSISNVYFTINVFFFVFFCFCQSILFHCLPHQICYAQQTFLAALFGLFVCQST